MDISSYFLYIKTRIADDIRSNFYLIENELKVCMDRYEVSSPFIFVLGIISDCSAI